MNLLLFEFICNFQKTNSFRFDYDIDLRGFLGISDDVLVGYQSIRVYFEIDADISEEQKEELVRMAKKYSPVFNTITKSTTVSVQLDN